MVPRATSTMATWPRRALRLTSSAKRSPLITSKSTSTMTTSIRDRTISTVAPIGVSRVKTFQPSFASASLPSSRSSRRSRMSRIRSASFPDPTT